VYVEVSGNGRPRKSRPRSCVDQTSAPGWRARRLHITAAPTREQQIKRIVAISHRGHILAPCGRCREFLTQLADANLDTRTVVNDTDSATLREVLPHRRQTALTRSWPTPRVVPMTRRDLPPTFAGHPIG
jgi:hypothetical protein